MKPLGAAVLGGRAAGSGSVISAHRHARCQPAMSDPEARCAGFLQSARSRTRSQCKRNGSAAFGVGPFLGLGTTNGKDAEIGGGWHGRLESSPFASSKLRASASPVRFVIGCLSNAKRKDLHETPQSHLFGLWRGLAPSTTTTHHPTDGQEQTPGTYGTAQVAKACTTQSYLQEWFQNPLLLRPALVGCGGGRRTVWCSTWPTAMPPRQTARLPCLARRWPGLLRRWF